MTRKNGRQATPYLYEEFGPDHTRAWPAMSMMRTFQNIGKGLREKSRHHAKAWRDMVREDLAWFNGERIARRQRGPFRITLRQWRRDRD